MKLTVVVYVQNSTNECLQSTLKSIKASTAKDYEIIVLDDGSNNSYKEIADKNGARYVKTEKRGAFASKLFAIEIAKGEYITFLNAGQEVTFNYYLPMLEGAALKNADIVCSGIAYEYKGVKFTCNEGDDTNELDINKVYSVALLKRAKKELEKTNITILGTEHKAEKIINTYALKNAQNILKMHTGFAFFAIDDKQIDVPSYGIELVKILNELESTKDQELYASALCLVAREQKQKNQIPQLQSIFNMPKIKPLSKKEASQYRKIELLGDNFNDIERALRKIYDTSIDVMVIYDMSSTYEKQTLEYIQARKAKNEAQKPLTLMVPKRITKQRVKLKPEQIFARVLLG